MSISPTGRMAAAAIIVLIGIALCVLQDDVLGRALAVGQVLVGLWLLRTGWRERVEERSALQRPRSEDAPGD